MSIIKVIPDKIHIESIRILSGNIECPIDYALSNTPIAGFATVFSCESRINPEEKKVLLLFSVAFDAHDKEGNKMPISGKYTFEYVVLIDNLEDYITSPNDAPIQIANILGATLVGILYSTSRGMLISRTQGTVLDGIILPVVDPFKLIGDPFKIQIPSTQNLSNEIISEHLKSKSG